MFEEDIADVGGVEVFDKWHGGGVPRGEELLVLAFGVFDVGDEGDFRGGIGGVGELVV